MTDAYRAQETDARVRGFFQQVYGWMAAALAVTGFVALAVARSTALQQIIFGSPFVFFGLIIGELFLVIWLASRIQQLTVQAATTLFIVYSVINGLTMGAVFLVYTEAVVAQAFFVTAGLFGVMTLVGFFTKADLTKLGQLLFMALLGFIIATVVNLFLRSEGLYWLITFAGIVIFVGLIAYDSQRIKEMALAGAGDSPDSQKYAIMGALRLYIDFVNLFLLLLRLFGRRR